jgi:peroxiredoxin
MELATPGASTCESRDSLRYCLHVQTSFCNPRWEADVEDQHEPCISLLPSLSAQFSNTKTMALELEVSSARNL